MIVLAVYIGCGLRGATIFWMGLKDPIINRLYLRGRNISEYGEPATIFLIGTAMVTLGYMLGRRRSAAADRPPQAVRVRTLVLVVALGCSLVGFWCSCNTPQLTVGPDLANLSAKRTAFYSGSGQYSGGAGQWRALNEAPPWRS